MVFDTVKMRLLATSVAVIFGSISLYWVFSPSSNSTNTATSPPREQTQVNTIQELPVVPGKCRPGGLSPFATDSSTCDVNASQEQSATQTVATNRPLMVKGIDVSKAIKTLEPGLKDNNFVYGELLDECLKPTAMNGTDREACTELLKHRGSWLGKLKVAARADNQTASVLLAKELQLLALDAVFNRNKVN
jgi:hypothetical protein